MQLYKLMVVFGMGILIKKLVEDPKFPKPVVDL